MVSTASQRNWGVIADRWRHVGEPLRPSSHDTANYSNLIGLPDCESLEVLILGVTPELFHLPWPAGSTVQAADRSIEMIEKIWPGPADAVCQADWLAMPFPPRSFDCVLCDGGLHLLEGPHLQRALSGAVSGILRSGGQFIVRLFAQPASPEDPQQIISDVHAGRIPNLHIFKLRLAMALQESFQTGIVLNDVYERVMEAFGGLDEICAATGWPHEEVFTLTSYCQAKNRYHFATESESIEGLTDGGCLDLNGRIAGSSTLGEQCPVLSFKKV